MEPVQETVGVPAKKPIIFSGIQPTGIFTLGNYIGAIRNWEKLQEDYRCIYSVVDLHAITVRQDPAELKKGTLSAYALLLASGIDPAKSTTFIQSMVPAHAELGWVLGCSTQFGELNRMTQFKDKSARYADNINLGLFAYPALMAADILLYQAALVPVGADQKQHLELTRDIATRFNGIYGNTFTIPDGYIPKSQDGARLMSLQDPTKKMSKSDSNPKGFVAMLDSPDTIIKKFRSAVTDSGSEVRYAEGKDGINNLICIYSVMTGKSFEAIEAEFAGHGYGDFKTAVGEAVAATFKPIQDKHQQLMADKTFLEQCYREGAEKASALAQRTLDKVYKKVGFIR